MDRNKTMAASAVFSKNSLHLRKFAYEKRNKKFANFFLKLHTPQIYVEKMRIKFYETNVPIQSEVYVQTEFVQEPNKFGCSKGQVFDSENQQCKGQSACTVYSTRHLFIVPFCNFRSILLGRIPRSKFAQFYGPNPNQHEIFFIKKFFFFN
jgi:hypothetical protein